MPWLRKSSSWPHCSVTSSWSASQPRTLNSNGPCTTVSGLLASTVSNASGPPVGQLDSAVGAPGTVTTTHLEGDGGVGTRYRNVSRFLGRTTELEYVVEEFQSPHLLQLRGENKTVVSVDTMTLTPTTTGGTTVHYRAEFTFKGAARLVAPLLAPAFKRLGDRAAEARMHRSFARVLTRLSRYDDAHAHLHRALELFGAVDDRAGQAKTHGILTRVRELGLAARRHARALGCVTVACGETRLPGDRSYFVGGEPSMEPAVASRVPDLLRSVVLWNEALHRLRQLVLIGKLQPLHHMAADDGRAHRVAAKDPG